MSCTLFFSFHLFELVIRHSMTSRFPVVLVHCNTMRIDKEVGPILSSTLGAKYDTLRRAELSFVETTEIVQIQFSSGQTAKMLFSARCKLLRCYFPSDYIRKIPNTPRKKCLAIYTEVVSFLFIKVCNFH